MKIKVLYFSIGFIACFVVLFSIAGILDYRDPYTTLRGFPKKFGDIKIAALKPADLRENEDIDEILMMTKDDIPFFYASANKSGKVTEVAILGAEKQIRFAMFTSESPSGWERAMYSCDRDNYTIGEEYIDFNFDGQFDAKSFYNDKGIEIRKYIYIDNDWKLVDSTKGKGVRVGGAKYVFDPNTGWRQDDANSPDKKSP
jgi:hypothetical protein